MSTIRKLPSGNYQALIRLSGLKPITKTFSTKRDATAFSRTIEGDMKLASALGDPILCNTTLTILIDNYIEQYTGKDNSVCGKAGNRKAGRLGWWKDHYGKTPLKDFTSSTIRTALKTLTCKPQTTNRYKAALSSVFEYAKDERIVRDNPCRDVKAKPEAEGRTRYFSAEEEKKLLIEVEKSTWDRLYLLILMALKTGARKSELLNSTWDRVQHGQLLLPETKNGNQRVITTDTGYCY